MRPIFAIADEISLVWKKPYFGAVPYIEAMKSLASIEDCYGFDPGREIVLYFLANANSFRGEDARRIKAELKGLL